MPIAGAHLAGTRRVREDYDSGVKSGVKGTPTFFINGKRYRGAVTIEAMSEALGASIPV